MTDESNTFDGTLSWDAVGQKVEAFRSAWRDGKSPSIETFLPEGPTVLRQAALVELIKAELSAHGCPEGCRVESYFERFPALAARENDCVDLICEEFRIRKDGGAAVAVEEYRIRFPAFSERLSRLLAGAPITEQPSVTDGGAGPAGIDVGKQIDDFDLLLKLGQGAFATVYLARQRSMQRMVALKVSTDRGNEHLALAQLDHPGIVRVYDQRTLPAENVRLLYMQYVPGGTLQSVVERVRKSSLENRNGSILYDAIYHEMSKRGEEHLVENKLRDRLASRSWGEAVCATGASLALALDYAHRQGVLHRDIKPANVLLGANASPRLADFNVSFSNTVVGDDAAEHFGGSLAYMAPEQIEAFDPRSERGAAELDERSDIYSLGLMLFELAAGERPFPDPQKSDDYSATFNEMLQMRGAGVSADALKKLPAHPPGLRRVLRKCLAPKREDRFSSARELAWNLQISLHPDAEEALAPPTKGLLRAATWAPLMALIVMGLIPNVITSVLSIAYNQINIINKLPDAKDIFKWQLAIVNPVAYGTAIALLLWLAWPVLSAVRNPAKTEGMSKGELQERRRRCVWIGDYVAWVTAAEWVFSGFVFPAWLHAAKGDVMRAEHYLHFFSSQFILGLIAATGSFFAITALATTVYYPRLLPESANLDDAQGRNDLTALGKRAWWYLLSTAAAFPLAVLTLLTINDTARHAFWVLSFVGLIYPLIAFRLMRIIQRDVAALTTAMSPLDQDAT